MSAPPNLLERIKTSLFKSYSNDAGKMLLHTGALAWATSAVAQIVGIINNDKISKEQKKFLVPQEMADAVVNIFSFYMVTDSIQNFTKKLASSGRIITPKIKEFCIEKGIKFEKIKGEEDPDIGGAILNKIKEYKSLKTLNINEKDEKLNLGLSNEKLNLIGKEVEKLDTFYDKTYSPFESGLKIIGNIAGAILSSNIITPLIRNKFAANKQKQDIAFDKKQAQSQAITPYTPVIPAQNRIGIDNYKSKTANTSSGSMRI